MTTTSFDSRTPSYSSRRDLRVADQFPSADKKVGDYLLHIVKDLGAEHGLQATDQIRKYQAQYDRQRALGNSSAAGLALQNFYREALVLADSASVREDGAGNTVLQRVEMLGQAFGVTGSPSSVGTTTAFRRGAEDLIRISNGRQSLYNTRFDTSALQQITEAVDTRQLGTSATTTSDQRSALADLQFPSRFNKMNPKESLTLNQTFGLDPTTVQKPDGFGYDQLFCAAVIRMTTKPENYANITTKASEEPDGIAKTYTYQQLKDTPAGSFTAPQLFAIQQAFQEKSGVTNCWPCFSVDGQQVPNKALIQFWRDEAEKRSEPAKSAILAASKYFGLAANYEAADLNRKAANLLDQPVLLAGNTTSGSTDISSF